VKIVNELVPVDNSNTMTNSYDMSVNWYDDVYKCVW